MRLRPVHTTTSLGWYHSGTPAMHHWALSSRLSHSRRGRKTQRGGMQHLPLCQRLSCFYRVPYPSKLARSSMLASAHLPRENRKASFWPGDARHLGYCIHNIEPSRCLCVERAPTNMFKGMMCELLDTIWTVEKAFLALRAMWGRQSKICANASTWFQRQDWEGIEKDTL